MYHLKKLLHWLVSLTKIAAFVIVLALLYYAAQTLEFGTSRDNSAPDEQKPLFEERGHLR